MAASITPRQLRALLKRERKRLNDCRESDFKKGRVNHSAATDDALSRYLLLEELLDKGGAAAQDDAFGLDGGGA